VNIVIPMAGHGSRLAGAGYGLPKPLVLVAGRPMLHWALDSLPIGPEDRVVIVCLEEHLRNHPLANRLDDYLGRHGYEVVALSEVTAGQLCTVLEAVPALGPDDGILIYNADTYCPGHRALDVASAEPNADGILGAFRAAGAQWSFAKVDDAGCVIETAEKRRISEWALTGLYWFRDAGRFVELAKAMVGDDERTRGEFYVAPLYNRLIAAGGDVRLATVEEVWSLGTPEEIERFEQANAPQARRDSR
jgi:dTDP-glucose pyrophosphorylase